MSDRITLRGRGCARAYNVGSIKAVSITDPRVYFINGWLTGGTDPADGSVESGDGTPYPMEVTGTVAEKFDKIWDLFTRVKDASFTGGSVSFGIGGSTATFYAPTAAYAARVFKYNAVTYQARGFTAAGGVHRFGGATYTSGGSTFSDIGTNEAGMWSPPWNGIAFNYSADDPNSTYGTDPKWFNAGGGGCRAEVRLSGRIAVVRANPGDSIFTATTRLFIEVEFYFYDYNPIINFGGTTNLTTFGPNVVHVCDYLIRMNSGILRAPFYFGTAGSVVGSHVGVDFTHDYTETWPYKTTAGDPAWDTATGAPANGGPGA